MSERLVELRGDVERFVPKECRTERDRIEARRCLMALEKTAREVRLQIMEETKNVKRQRREKRLAKKKPIVEEEEDSE